MITPQNSRIDFRLEKIILWTLLSFGTTVVLLSIFFLDHDTILEHTPACLSQVKYHKECFACGMTRAFIRISQGDFSSAMDLNRGSIFLFVLFLVNSVLYLRFILQRISTILHTRAIRNCYSFNHFTDK